MNLVRSLMCLVVLTALVGPKGGEAAETRTALVIGNSNYSSSPLINPSNDARDLAKVLKTLDFDVTVLTDQSQRQMKLAVRSFKEKLKKRGGVGLFYYAGHGMEVGGQNYLIPVGAEIPSESYVDLEAVPMREVTAGLADARNRMNIVILDACRNNPFARSFRSSSRGLAVMRAPAETLIAYATEPGSVAADGVGTRNSPYAEALMASIQEPGLRLVDVLRRTRSRVRDATNGQQIPWQSDNLTSDAFYFRPRTSNEPVTLAVVKPAPAREREALSSDVVARGMVNVPAGKFYSGCNKKVDSDCYGDEKPGKTRGVDAFKIDMTEVTVSAFQECVRAGYCEEPQAGGSCNWGNGRRGDHPVNCVDWNQAKKYCEWKGSRLPTEWEWEKAARGTDGRKYAWGNQAFESGPAKANIADRRSRFDWRLNNYDDDFAETSPVGNYPSGASPYGALDMIGNVGEWTSSKYPGYESRVVRGGSCYDEPWHTRASERGGFGRNVRLSYIGFRCAQ